MKRLGFLLPLVLLAADFPSAEVRIVGRALHFIENNYVDPQNLDARKMLASADRELERNIAPLVIHEQSKRLELLWRDRKEVIDLPDPFRLDDLPPVFRRLLGFLQTTYEGKLEPNEREQLALNGIVETLDPHSNFLSPKIYNEFKIGTKGNFGGLGIVIGIREGYLTVIEPLEGTPAARAGLKAKDRIEQIGEEATINMSLTDAVGRLRGPVGSKVALVIRRDGMSEPLHVNLTRDLIQIRSVAGVLIPGTRIGLIKLKNFQEDTLRELEKKLESFSVTAGGPLEGLVLDLRNNPGGLLDQAIRVADKFLASGVIVKTVGPLGKEVEVETAKPGSAEENLPMVLIVNEGSASASEIIAGALQYNNRAIVLGNRTFGKGSVQTVYDLKDGSALKLTVAKYLAGGDHEVQSVGITPDIKLIPATVDPKRVDLFEGKMHREDELTQDHQPISERKPESEMPRSPYQLRYLAASEEEEDKPASSLPEQDFPVQLAAEILRMPESRDRQKLLKSLPPVVEKFGKEGEEKIAEALEKIGLNWSEEDKKGRPKAVAQVELWDEKENRRESLTAGETGFVKLTVENRGTGPFYRLVGVTQSEDPLFANLEFPIGRLAPGEKREWKAVLKVPEMVVARSEPVVLNFYESEVRNSKEAADLLFNLRIQESPPARFQYSYTVEKMNPPERIGLRFKVTNGGSGESSKAVINLKSLSGDEVFIEKGRGELGAIPPGQSREALLVFRLTKETLPPKLPFELSIHDSRFGWQLSDRLEIPVGEGQATPAVGSLQSPPVIDFSPASPPLSVSRDSYTLKGEAKDDQIVRHLFIFVGDEKVFYKNSEKEGKSLSFEAVLKLKKGMNRISITAEDDRDLSTDRQWIVWRN